MIRNEILIASHGEDSATVEPVARLLRDAGREVLFYESDKVATGAVEFSIRLTGDQPEITYDGQEFVPEAILAAWSRRPNEFGLNDVYRKRLLSSYRAPQVFFVEHGAARRMAE